MSNRPINEKAASVEIKFKYNAAQSRLLRKVQRGGGTYVELISPQCLEVGGQRSGKGFSPDTNVVTPYGHRAMRDLCVGSILSNPEGSVSRVIGVYPRGLQQFYRITFRDGDVIECDGDHIWPYFTRQRQLSGKRELPYVLGTARQLWERFQTGSKNHYIKTPATLPLDFTPDNFTVDPYTIGVLIGDGGLSCGAVQYASDDPEIAEYIPEETTKLKAKFLWSVKGISKELRNLGLSGKRAEDKFIPSKYLWASIESRWKLLQGLMDTDGTCDKAGHVSFCTVSPKLAKDFKFLVQSLGGIATLGRPQNKFYRDEVGAKIYGQPAYVIYISFPDDAIIFKLKRKQSRRDAKAPRGCMPKTLWRTIINIQKIDVKESICIKVDHPNGLFLVDNCIVTHNTTGKLMHGVLDYCLKFRKCDMLVLRRTIAELDNIIKDLEKWVPEDLFSLNKSTRIATFTNGSRIIFAGCANDTERDIEKYLGQAFPYIQVSECAQFSPEIWTRLYARNLVNATCESDEHGNLPVPRIVGDTNPIGAHWEYYYTVFVKKIPWEKGENAKQAKDGSWWRPPYKDESRDVIYNPADYAYNHTTILDNPEYMKRDPGMIARLRTMPKHQREIFLLGRMDSQAGQYFDCWTDDYVVDLREDPLAVVWEPWQPVIGGQDWGVGHANAFYLLTRALVRWTPTSDYKSRILCFREVAPETTGLTAVEFADLINISAYYPTLPDNHPQKELISGKRCKISAIAFSHEKFNRVMEAHSPADEYSRLLRERGLPPVSRAVQDRIGSAGYMYDQIKRGNIAILKTCPAIIQAIPALQRDPKRLDDVLKTDAKGDDRYDAFRYCLYMMFKERGMPEEIKQREEIDKLAKENPFAAHFRKMKLAAENKKKTESFVPPSQPLWMNKI